MTTSSSEPDSELVEHDIAELLVRIQDDWVPMPVPRRKPVQIQWGSTDLSGQGQELVPSDEQLLLLLDTPYARGDLKAIRDPLSELHGQPLSGSCEDGATFLAKQAVSLGVELPGRRADTIRATVAGHDWQIVDPRRKPLLWVGEIQGEPATGIGNLELSIGQSFSRGHYRFRGARLTYYLLKVKRSKAERFLLVMQSTDCDPDPWEISSELTLLGFAFGQPFGLRRAFGIDSLGFNVAAMGGKWGVTPLGHSGPDTLVPAYSERATWIVPFFECLANYANRTPLEEREKLRLGIWYYLDSLNEHTADGALLKRYLGLVAVAKHIVQDGAPFTVDVDKWVSFVQAHEELLLGTAISGRESLKRSIMNEVKARSSDIIFAALESAGLTATPEMVHAVRAGEAGLLAEQISPRELYPLMAFLRTMLVALVAKTVNYDGPIAGWDKFEPYYFYHHAPESWWAVGGTAPAADYFAGVERAPLKVKDVWPLFNVPEVPDDGPVAIIAGFAGSLVSKTLGLVVAQVEPVPAPDDEIPAFDFVVRATNLPSAQTVLFSMQVRDNEVAISGWGDDRVLTDEVDIQDFLKEVATSPDTRLRIQRLLLAARAGGTLNT